MAKLRMPEDRQSIHWIIFDRMLGLESAGHQLAINQQCDPRLVSHQLGLQGKIEDPSVRMGVDELIGEGRVVTLEPAWVSAQQEGSPVTPRVLYARTVV